MTNNRTIKGNLHVRNFLKIVSVLQKITLIVHTAWVINYTLQKNSDNYVLGHRAGATNADNLALAGRVIIEDLSWYVPHYTRNISNQKLILGHFVSKDATELSYTIRSFYLKNLTTENNWTFELGIGDGIDIPIYVKFAFMQRDQFNQQHQKNDTFYTPSVVNAHCIIVSEKFPDAGINCFYAIDKYSQAYAEIGSCFRRLAKDNILQAYITQKDFISSNKYPDGNHA